MDKVYSGFGPLTTFTDPSSASSILNHIKDSTRIVTAQSQATAPSQAKKLIEQGRTFEISFKGALYNTLSIEDKKKVVNYYIDAIRGNSILGSRENAIRWAFKEYPGLFKTPMTDTDHRLAINYLSQEIGALDSQAAAQGSSGAAGDKDKINSGEQIMDTSGLGITGLSQNYIAAAQLLFQVGLISKNDVSTINNDPFGAGKQVIQAAVQKGLASKNPSQKEAAEIVQNMLSEMFNPVSQPSAQGSASAAAPGAAAGAAPGTAAAAAAAAAGAGGGAAAGGLAGAIAKGISAVIQFILGMPNSPKVSPQVLVNMVTSDTPQFWFPNNQIAANGFYGPYKKADGIYWAEVEYDYTQRQFMFSGRYAFIPQNAVSALQQAASKGP